MDTPLVEPLRLFGAWVVAGRCMVRDRNAKMPGQIARLVPNRTQQVIFQSWLKQARAGKALRTLIPKARKQGVSTWVQALFYFLCKYIPNFRAFTGAHTAPDAAEIFDATRTIARYDDPALKPGKMLIEWPDVHSRYVCRSALGDNTGSGGNNTAVHLSEVPKMQREAGGDVTAMASIISSVPQFSPSTIVVLEGTGQGPTGDFYNRCMIAANEPESSEYDLCFFPWFHDPLYRDPEPEEFKPTEYEQRLMTEHSVSPGQLLWRRRMLKTEYANNEIAFRWDYPSSLEEAFDSPSGRMLPTFDKNRHVKTLKETGLEDRVHKSHVVCGTDFGAGPSPFVNLWIRHFPGERPGLTVDPACRNFIREALSWCRDPKTGRPMEDNDHSIDAARYVIATLRLDGHVHIYREMYVTNAASKGETHLSLGREVLRLSRGEQIVAQVCDKAEPLTINDLLMLGLPARPYERLPGALGDSDIEQGVKRILALLDGTEWFYDTPETTLQRARVKMAMVRADGRDKEYRLSREEEEALEHDRRAYVGAHYQDNP